jgi:alkanesulfonate monooxygenase
MDDGWSSIVHRPSSVVRERSEREREMTMGLEFGWYVPNDGDGRYVGIPQPEIYPTLENLARVIQTAERVGFDTILVPTNQQNNTFSSSAPYIDSIVSAAALAPLTSSIKLLVAIRMGTIDPGVCARMGATLDLLSNGRFLINIVTGGNPLGMYGEQLDHDARYRRTDEYVQILKGLWTTERFSFEGEFYRFSDAICWPKPLQKPHPPIYFPGASEIARQIAAREADYYLMHGETLPLAAERVQDMERRLRETGRCLRYGIRFQIVARETEAAALEAGQQLLSRIDPEVLKTRAAMYARTESVGQRRLNAQTEQEMVAPNLWGGMRKVRAGAGTALLGSYEQVADRILEYHRAGLNLFIFSGYPMAEEAERIGERVIPLVRERMLAAAG